MHATISSLRLLLLLKWGRLHATKRPLRIMRWLLLSLWSRSRGIQGQNRLLQVRSRLSSRSWCCARRSALNRCLSTEEIQAQQRIRRLGLLWGSRFTLWRRSCRDGGGTACSWRLSAFVCKQILLGCSSNVRRAWRRCGSNRLT